MSRHDEIFSLLFGEFAMQMSLLRGFGERLGIPAGWLRKLALGSVEVVTTNIVAPNLTKRQPDLVLRVWLRGARRGRRGASGKRGKRRGRTRACPYVLVLVEFQSWPDYTMPARMMEYALMLRQEAMRKDPDTRSPLIIPIVIHSGRKPWLVRRDTAALYPPFAPEEVECALGVMCYLVLDIASYPLHDLPEGEPVSRLIELLRAASEEEARKVLAAAVMEISKPTLRHAFHELTQRSRWFKGKDGKLLPFDKVEEGRSRGMAHVETIMDYNARVWQTKRDKRLRTRWLRKGRSEGVAEGLAKGVAEHRALLSRQAGIRFGAEVSGQFAALLEQIDDFGRLDEIGELILTCETGEELLTRTNGGG